MRLGLFAICLVGALAGGSTAHGGPLRLTLVAADLRKVKGAPQSAAVTAEIGAQVIRTEPAAGPQPRWDHVAEVERPDAKQPVDVHFLLRAADAGTVLLDRRVKLRAPIKAGTFTIKGPGAASLIYKLDLLADEVRDERAEGPAPAKLAAAWLKGKRKGGGPAGTIDPAAVQSVVDSHGAEVEACVNDLPDPRGQVVLIFSISADGTPLGVLVESAAPTLQKAGECIRKKALRWRFPRPRGVAMVRYPIRFDTQ